MQKPPAVRKRALMLKKVPFVHIRDLGRVYSAKPIIHTPVLRDIHTIKKPHLEEIPGPDKFRKGFISSNILIYPPRKFKGKQKQIQYHSRKLHPFPPTEHHHWHNQNKCGRSRMLWTPFLRQSTTRNSGERITRKV